MFDKMPKDLIVKNLLYYLSDWEIVQLTSTCKFFRADSKIMGEYKRRQYLHKIKKFNAVPDYFFETTLVVQNQIDLKRLYKTLKQFSVPFKKVLYTNAIAESVLYLLLGRPDKVDKNNIADARKLAVEATKTMPSENFTGFIACKTQLDYLNALFYFIRCDEIDMVREIKTRRKLSVKNAIDNLDMYDHALVAGANQTIDYLATKKNKLKFCREFPGGGNALHLAALNGHTSTCHKLVDNELDISKTDHNSELFHHQAARGGYWLCYLELEKKYFANEPLKATRSGHTAIHIAAKASQIWFIKQAVAHYGEDCLTTTSNDGKTPLELLPEHLRDCFSMKNAPNLSR